MHCPNCQHILSHVQLGELFVDHCNNCGATLFEPNIINRITLKDAERLAMMKENDSISGTQKVSPRDGSVLVRLQNDSIPQHVTLLHSPSTGEIFAFADDLVEFKKAQSLKIDYYKAWRIPLPQLQNVLVLGLVLVFTASVAYISTALQNPTSKTIRAQELCQGGIEQLPQENSTLVSCLTSVPLTCKIEAKCGASTQFIQTTSSDTTHFGTVQKGCQEARFVCSERSVKLESVWVKLK